MSRVGDAASRPPTGELGPVGPFTDDELLAAVTRAQRQDRMVNLSRIANHLGWRYNGAATIRLRPALGRLVSEGLLTTTEPPAHKRRSQEWRTTPAGKNRLAAVGPVPLPESPQHRRWRQDRDVAMWAIDAVRAQARRVAVEVYDLLWDRAGPIDRPVSDLEIRRVTAEFDKAMRALALASQMCGRWPEPSDDERGEDPDHVGLLLPDLPKQRRR
jgi:hypothetical protein